MYKLLWLFILVCCSLAGCSSIAPKRETIEITISTNPPGSNLKICNERSDQCLTTAKTPYTMILQRSQDLSWPAHYTILCEKKGFRDISRTLHFGTDGWYLLIVDRESDQTLEVWNVDGHTIELELPKAQAVNAMSVAIAGR
jgi:uncharacterized protein YceK